jgi:hypothetical protein
MYTLEYEWDVVKRCVNVVYNLVLSIVSHWNIYDEHTFCYMEHILPFRLCVDLQTVFWPLAWTWKNKKMTSAKYQYKYM